MAVTGSSWSVAAGASEASDGMSAARPLPRPLRRSTTHLPGELAIGDGTPRGRIERHDRLPVRRRFGQPHGAGHDVAAHAVTEVAPHFMGDLVGQLRAGV